MTHFHLAFEPVQNTLLFSLPPQIQSFKQISVEPETIPKQNAPAQYLCLDTMSQYETPHRQFCDDILVRSFQKRYTGNRSIPTFRFRLVQEARFQTVSEYELPMTQDIQPLQDMQI